MKLVTLAALSALAVPAFSQDPVYVLVGKSPNAQYGSSVTSPGDLDGDGYPDLILGAAIDGRVVTKGGALEVRSGRSRELLYTYLGNGERDELGFAGAGAGDVNNDGVPDIAVACIGGVTIGGVGDDQPFIGHARVYSGKDGRRLHVFLGKKLYDFYGLSVSGLGDLNGDGHADVGIGAPGVDDELRNRGALEVRSGKDGALLHRILGHAEHDQFGWFHRPVDDLDADGVMDFVVGAPGHLLMDDAGNPLRSGYAELRSGASGELLRRFEGEGLGDRFGWCVARIDDWDGDGLADVVIGAPFRDTAAGADAGAFYVFGSKSGERLARVENDEPGAHFGWCVFSEGDVDGDGRADAWVTAPASDANGEDSGLTVLFSGSDQRELVRIPGRSAGDESGYSVLDLGIVEGDQREIVVGARSDDVATGEMVGAASVYRLSRLASGGVRIEDGDAVVEAVSARAPEGTEEPETFHPSPAGPSVLLIIGAGIFVTLIASALLMRRGS